MEPIDKYGYIWIEFSFLNKELFRLWTLLMRKLPFTAEECLQWAEKLKKKFTKVPQGISYFPSAEVTTIFLNFIKHSYLSLFR